MAIDLSVKSMIVHCPSVEAIDRLLSVAIPLATRMGARLFGLHVMPRAEIYAEASMAAGTELIVMQQQQHQADAAACEAKFRQLVSDARLEVQWRAVDPIGHPTMDVAIRLSRGVDLVIASQADRTINPDLGYSPADLVIGAGRPVLLVPGEGRFMEIGTRVLVAWSARRESARAAFDCLPLLQEASRMRFLEVKPDHGEVDEGLIDGPAVAGALSRHNLEVDTIISSSSQHGIGEEILAQAAEYNADMLVMGCYGHSRLREFVFGGATAHVLKSMDRPVLMAH